MIGNQKQRDDGFVTVATKVPPHVAELLNIIAASKGTDIYGLLQLFIEVIITAAKATTHVSPKRKLLLHMLEVDAGWNNAFNFVNPTAQMDIAQMILILQQHDGKRPREGFGMVMIDKPFMGDQARQTLCVDDILERVAEVSMNGLYKELRQVGIALETESLRETLTTLCDGALIEHLNEMDAAEGPQVGNFSDFGKAIEWGKRTKRKPRRTPDSLANSQTTIQWTDDDREIAEYEAEGWEGEIRQREENPSEC